MSSFPQGSFPGPPIAPPPQGLSTGLAIAGLVTAIAGLCIPIVGIVGLILSIVALVNASKKPQEYGGKGLAIGGVVCGSLSIVVGCLSIAILLPALGKARQSARQIKSGSQLRMIGQGLIVYAMDNKDTFPEVGADLTVRLAASVGDPELWVSPQRPDESTEPSYLYVGGQTNGFSSKTVLAFENPAFHRNGVNVVFQDAHTEFLTKEEFAVLLPTLKNITTPEGKPWSFAATTPGK